MKAPSLGLVSYSVFCGLLSGSLGAYLMMSMGTTLVTSFGVTIGTLLICSIPLKGR